MTLLAETSFSFAHPWAFALLLLLPVLALLRSRSGGREAVVFSSLHILQRLGPMAKGRAGGFRAALLFLAMACTVAALARPQMVDRTERISESGVELIVAIDVSRSMSGEDFFIDSQRVSRLVAAKKVTRDFVRQRTTDRIGLLAFAGRPYLASPLTLSKDWLLGDQGLGRVQIGLVEDGTAIGSAIAAAAKRLDKRESKSKVVVLVTDGVSNAGKLSPVEAAKMARTLGIRVYPIAVGTYGDVPIQTPLGTQMLRQEFDEETLKQIAEITRGEYFRAQDTNSLERIFEAIDELEKTEIKRSVRIESTELYPWCAAAALVFGLLVALGDETFWRRYP